MADIIKNSLFFGGFLTLGSYFIGLYLKKRFKFALFNPLLIGAVITVCTLLVFKIDVASYNSGAKYISYLLTPATVCLAVPLYNQLQLLKENYKGVLAGIAVGALTSLLCVFAFALLFKFDNSLYVTLLPKSITTAIGMGISQELGGYVSITVAVIVITGILGNITAPAVCKICKITSPVAKGVAIGTASHAIGTAKALEMGEIEGAMSSLSIVVCGILTVTGAGIFAGFI